MFESTHRFAFFDYLRVPYQIRPGRPAARVGMLRARRTVAGARPRRLFWALGGTRAGVYRIGGFTVAGRLLPESPSALLGSEPAAAWRPDEPVRDSRGRTVASVWRNDDGDVFVPFDPGEIMRTLWSEDYTGFGHAGRTRRLRAVLVRGYYLLRPLMPRRLQLLLRRVHARRRHLPSFPAWPVEHGLHDFYTWLLDVVTEIAGEPVPWLSPWPDGRGWAMVLTHDVETDRGYRDIELLRSEERLRGYRSSWNFVPERYEVEPERLADLQRDGCEIGVHGLRHDGHDLASAASLSQRLPAIQDYAHRWGATGFRSPATQRAWDLMPLLGFDYDSSYTDTDPYEPQPGGCCTYLPFFIEDTVELPITLPQDHTIFAILRRDGALWVDKARQIRSRGGMVLVLTHPDYARLPAAGESWRALLDAFTDDPTVWQALPREVAAWWRARAASVPERTGDVWTVRGPAASRATMRLSGSGVSNLHEAS